MNIQSRITEKLEASVNDHYGYSSNVVAIASVEEAEFFGLLMKSALQDSSFLEVVESERLLVWAIVVDGRTYIAGSGFDSEGRVAQFQTVLGYNNRSDETSYELNDIFVGVLRAVNSEIYRSRNVVHTTHCFY
jgi:hypothetical protein